MKVLILLMSVATASALFGAVGPLSVGADEDYGGAAAEPFPVSNGRDARPSVRFADEGMNVIFNEGLNLWEEPVKKGVWCVVGEFGCANHTVHADSLRFLESSLRLFNEMGMGWCCWGFIGSRFGILNSRRRDVKYEDWHGSKLDRKMLELLRSY